MPVNRDYAKSQEYRVRDLIRRLGLKAERVPLSGACAAIGKGDVNVEDGMILIDHKSTRGKDGISIKRSDLEKIEVDAGVGNLGIITLSYLNNNRIYAVLPIESLIAFVMDRVQEVKAHKKATPKLTARDFETCGIMDETGQD